MCSLQYVGVYHYFIAGFYPPSHTNEYTEASEGGDDWLAKLAVDWENAGTLPENIPTRRVIIRSG